MHADDIVLCLSTRPDPATAAAIARQLVSERLAACVNIAPSLRSIYRWEGAIQDEPEVLLIIKTTRAALPALKAALPPLHPYTQPELIALPIDDGLPGYLQWVADSVAQA